MDGMDSIYLTTFRFSKSISKIFVILAISLLIFVYFITLNGTNTIDTKNVVFDGETSRNKILPNVLQERIERDEHSVNEGKVLLCE